MNKIYLVEFYRGDYDTTDIYAYCSNYRIAQEQKQKILDKIENIKTLYYLEYGSNFDKDLEALTGYESKFFDEWDKVEDRVFSYLMKHPELNFGDIEIIEKELL